MLYLINNRILTKDRERTLVVSPISVGGTTFTVKAVDTNSWADNDWLIVGEIGTPTAEVLQVNGAISDGTSITVDNAGAGGSRFAHGVDEPVYRIDFNKIKVYRATTKVGAKTNLTTVEVMPDNFESRYEDTANTTGFGFVTFFNTFTNGESPYSDAIPYTGQTQAALASMIGKVRTLTDEQSTDFISDDDIVDGINDKQRDILNERLWTFNEIERSASSVAYQFEYDVDSDIKTLHTTRFRTAPLALVGEARWEMLHWNTNQTSSRPMAAAVWNKKLRIYPTPGDSAANTTLGVAITTTTATTINVVASSSFKKGDYYRFVIDSEVIYATNNTTTTFTGCLRGQEGSTAATHLIAATVTELDIVEAGQAVPVDLAQLNDETVVPEPIVVCYGVSADLCHGKLNKQTLGDRYDLKFKAGMEDLGNRFSIKMTSQPNRVKDPLETISDNGVWQDPNNYPTNVSAS